MVHNILGSNFRKEGLTSGVSCMESQKCSHAGGLFLGNVIFDGTRNSMLSTLGIFITRCLVIFSRKCGDTQGCQQDGGRLHLHHFFTHTTIVFLTQGVIFVPCKSTEQIIFTHPKESGKFFVVGRHKLGFGRWCIGHSLTTNMTNLKNVVDIFDCAESFRVQVQHTGGFQLFKTCLQMQFNTFGRPTFPASYLIVGFSTRLFRGCIGLSILLQIA
mmetsp:Transcript_5524/g.6735  ORF Transcript_5524/g.6735 Transcript_5524/m.6735 type:complete len:215 (+) Transcript_5524:643-1287(+)